MFQCEEEALGNLLTFDTVTERSPSAKVKPIASSILVGPTETLTSQFSLPSQKVLPSTFMFFQENVKAHTE
ncbi:hypothetical protein STEG23_012538 [Scotinomys teguina]